MPKEKLTNKVIFLMSKFDITEIDRIADEKHMSRSSFIRQCIREGIKNNGEYNK